MGVETMISESSSKHKRFHLRKNPQGTEQGLRTGSGEACRKEDRKEVKEREKM